VEAGGWWGGPIPQGIVVRRVRHTTLEGEENKQHRARGLPEDLALIQSVLHHHYVEFVGVNHHHNVEFVPHSPLKETQHRRKETYEGGKETYYNDYKDHHSTPQPPRTSATQLLAFENVSVVTKEPPRPRTSAMQLLAFENITVSTGGLLCNDTYVITTFALHGQYQSAAPPGCFGSQLHRVIHVSE